MALFSWRKKQVQDSETEQEQGFFDHLEELRWHLFRAAVVVAVIAGVLFVFREPILGTIFMYPFDADFPMNQFLCNNLGGEFCNDIVVKVIATSPYEQFVRAISYSFFGGVIIAFPYIVFEIWRFVRPALSMPERKKVRGSVLIISFLFFFGVGFAYFVILPFSVQFLTNFELFSGIENYWSVGAVINFVLMLLLGTGAVFQLPIVIFYLTRIGMMSSEFLIKYRRHAAVVLLILSAFVTPPDPFSMIAIFMPLYLLFEIGIAVSRRVERKQKLKELEEYNR